MVSGVLAVKAIGVSDAYFVGQLGEDKLAAISYTFPIVMTLISLAMGIDTAFVSTHHLVRMIFLVVAGPAIFALIRKKLGAPANKG